MARGTKETIFTGSERPVTYSDGPPEGDGPSEVAQSDPQDLSEGIEVGDWEGPKTTRTRTRTRKPSPFDDAVADAKVDGRKRRYIARNEEHKEQTVKELRRAGTFHDASLRVRFDPENPLRVYFWVKQK